ncbi:MAG: NAD-dependent epimerase/dehydratase family protein [Bacteroidales bacterium]|jgi:nucleoside-diphosphate-sugar epimerase|nr:NAD-dependent epimerase/dehydratase family protein [Bacteroidales bacterium]MDD2204483.1 NAD-dependent epimerase/dehydratase family protein [Bacteroidales bacterium]MDD3914849.1 NAD-dependent epimerase/dehydratase family protein [Bacteroidales bacterium]MDD4633834.1 NAD-dependent epimerase/dehydratase family protein [Bacteroidales bacterium]
MKNVLVIGCAGQIGSELVLELRRRYGVNNVIGTDIAPEKIKGILAEGPTEALDVRDRATLTELVKKYKIDTIYNLAALLSAVAEAKPQLAWEIGLMGHYGVLETAREQKCAVFFPSSIGSFGLTTPHKNTPQDTIQRPNTMYGVTKVSAELLGDYYNKKFGVDSRGVRFPGIISNVTLPGGGTTDYAVEIYYKAVETGKFVCPLKAGTFLDMMYMPDAIKAAIEIMEADPAKLKHHNGFNISSMSFDPEIIKNAIQKRIPEFEMVYDVEPIKQAIADSWPDRMDDSCAREEWGWKPSWDLDSMTDDMINTIRKRMNK